MGRRCTEEKALRERNEGKWVRKRRMEEIKKGGRKGREGRKGGRDTFLYGATTEDQAERMGILSLRVGHRTRWKSQREL